MSGQSTVPRPDPRVADLVGELPRELFTEDFGLTVNLLEGYGLEWAVELAHRLGLPDRLSEPTSAADLATAGKLAPPFEPALEWILGRLAGEGLLEVAPGAGGQRYRCSPDGLRASRRDELREQTLGHDPANAAAIALLDAAGEAYEAVASGEKTGEEILLGPACTALWLGYFNNANPIYAINNLIAAHTAVNRLPAEGTFRILEVGAGAGSATEALLGVLAERGMVDRLDTYRMTEPSPFFRRRGERSLPAAFPEVSFEFAGLDVDLDWAEQGVADGTFDLVFGVNVFHVAKDLGTALQRALGAVKPGGAVMAAECIRPVPGRRVTAEMVFQLLKGFNEVDLVAESRPTAGFLTPEQWDLTFTRAGAGEIELIPDIPAIRDVYPNFLAGAICGRRAAES